MTGCVAPNGSPNNTGTGALTGGLLGAISGALIGGRHAGEGALIGGLTGAFAGGLIGNMIDQQQQQRLQLQSPQTLQTIQHNDAVYQQQQQASQTQASGQSPQAQTQSPPAEALTPLTVDDIKALNAAGVKKEAITQEIDRSNSKFSAQDIAAAQQANVDPAVIECMKSHAS